VLTLSGIFRDLLPLQVRLLAEAALLAAQADEPADQNFVRAHALATVAEQGCTLEDAALRVFGNADGAYGSNVNLLVESGRWSEPDELAEQFVRRKCFAYGVKAAPVARPALMQRALADVSLSRRTSATTPPRPPPSARSASRWSWRAARGCSTPSGTRRSSPPATRAPATWPAT
jgi:magnesium chelatase subunit H